MRLAGSQFLHKLGFCIKSVCFGHLFFNFTYSNPRYFHKSLWMLPGLHAEGCKPSQPQEKMLLLLSHLLSATAQGLLLSNSKESSIIATLYKCIWRGWFQGLLGSVTGTALPGLPGASTDPSHANKMFQQENGHFLMGEADSWVLQ